jgi:hypothetical protein
MKKILLLAILALFTSGAFAQGLGFGARISYQSEAMMGDDAEGFADETVSSGFGGGMDVLYHFSPMVGLHSGLIFQLNAYSWTTATVDYSYMFLNLQVPVLARINFTPGFFAEAGLDMSINMLATAYDEISDEWEDMDDWNTFQLGLTAGAGYTLWFGLEFSGRFSYGLLDPADWKPTPDIKPFRFQFDVSYWFKK